MLKIAVSILIIIAVVESGKCPHSLNKRQAPGPGGPGGTGGPAPGGDGNTLIGPAPGGDGNTPPESVRPPPEDKHTVDRRPTEKPTQPPPPVQPGNCNPDSLYSPLDASCNNLKYPSRGRPNSNFKRYLPAEYQDGVSAPRTLSVFGGSLPNPRLISRALMNDNTEFENNISDLLVYMGQFVAHDVTEILDTEVDGFFVSCPCGSTDPNCLSYVVPPLDEKLTQSCFEFTRSGANSDEGYYEQVNHLSAFLDATQVYGSSKEISDELRTFSNGLLKTSNGDGKNSYLPLSETDFDCSINFDKQCFIAGESRPSENLALTSVHTTFMREHNRIATALKNLNKLWTDEKIFQEARRINTALYQHIIYNEWLPLVIGNNDLKPRTTGYFNGYDSSVDPNLSNEFATAAFRFGHTLIRDQLDRYNTLYQNVGSDVDLSSIIFDTTEAYNTEFGLGGMEAIFMGLLAQPTSKFDSSIVDTLQNHLFEFSDGVDIIAVDLAATNINRGRDHGIPGYYKYREICGSRIRKWEDLSDVMTTENIAKLRTVYASFRDIDLFVGGLHETPVINGVVGPTFACIIKKTFGDLKKGDRFYYENGPSSIAFTTSQLNEIRKASMAGLICENFNGVNSVQPRAYEMPYSSIGNSVTSCNNIAKMDLSKWKV